MFLPYTPVLIILPYTSFFYLGHPCLSLGWANYPELSSYFKIAYSVVEVAWFEWLSKSRKSRFGMLTYIGNGFGRQGFHSNFYYLSNSFRLTWCSKERDFFLKKGWRPAARKKLGQKQQQLQVDRFKLTMELARKEGAGMSLANKRGSLIVLIKRNPGKPRENHPIP